MENKPGRKGTSFNRALVPILLVNFVGMLGYSIIMPLMPYYAERFNAGPFEVGLLTASYALCSFVAGPVLGRLSDSQGRRPWLLFSQLGTILGFIVMAIGGSIWMLFLGRIIDGISGGNQVIAQAYVGDVTRPEDRTRTFGLMAATFGLGAVIGPLLGGVLSQFGLAAPFWAAAGIALITLVVTFFMLPESREKSPAQARGSVFDQFKAIGAIMSAPKLNQLFALFAAMTLSMSLFVSSVSLFVQLQLKAPAAEAGLGMAYFGVMMIVLQALWIPRAVRWLGEQRMIPLGFTSMAIGSAGVFFAGSWPTMLLATTFIVFGMATLRSPLMSLISQVAGPQQQGVAMGSGSSIDSIGQVIAPVAGGWMIAQFTPGTPSLVGAVVALIGLGLFAGLRRTLPRVARSGPAVQIAPVGK